MLDPCTLIGFSSSSCLSTHGRQYDTGPHAIDLLSTSRYFSSLGGSSQFTSPRPVERQHCAAPHSANTSFLFPLVYLPRDPLLWLLSVGPERGPLYLHHFCVSIVFSPFLVSKKFYSTPYLCINFSTSKMIAITPYLCIASTHFKVQ